MHTTADQHGVAQHGVAAIAVDGVGVELGGRRVLSDIALTVAPGETVALLGPNGAGKTTLVDCLEGFRRPDQGTVRVMGQDPWRAPRSWRERIGVILQDTRLDADLSVAEFAQMTALWYSEPQPVDAMLDRVGMLALRHQKVHRLSGGERRRLDLALAMIGSPELLFLDEPTTGLDPSAKRDIWGLISDLAGDGVSVLLTSHDLQEVEHLADRIVILRGGEVSCAGTAEQIRDETAGGTTISFVTGSAETAVNTLGAHREAETGRFILATEDVSQSVVQLNRSLGEDLVDVQVSSPTFEDAYLRLLRADAHASC